jgi:MFS family permease
MGALVATYGVGMIVGFYPAGRAVERYGAARVLAVSIGLMALGALGFVVVESLPVYFASRFLMGLGSGGLWLAIALGVIERWPGREYRRLSGVMASYSVGGIAGPALGAIGGIRGPFLAYIGLTAIGLGALRLIGPPHRHAPTFGSDRAVLRSPAFAVSAAGVALVSITIGTLDGVLPLHFDDRLGQAGIAALYVWTSLLVALFAVLATRFPLRPTLVTATGCMAGGLALAGASGSLWVWIVALAITAVGFGLGETSSLGFLLEAVGPEQMVLAMAVWSQIFALAYLVGPLAGGAIAATLGYGAIGLAPLAVALLVLVALGRYSTAVEDRTIRSRL